VRRRRGNWLWLLVIILAGAIAGGAVGQVLRPSVPLLGESVVLGLEPPLNLDLFSATLTFGFTLRFNLMSAVGVFLALLVGRRL